jgi:hypothetical protein
MIDSFDGAFICPYYAENNNNNIPIITIPWSSEFNLMTSYL